MNQPLSKWGPASPAPSHEVNLGPPSAATSVERHVLMRLPDCSLAHAGVGTGAASLLVPATWVSLIAAAFGDFARQWRQPRKLLAGSLGVLLVLGVVALWFTSRRHSTPHASNEQPRERLDAPAESKSDTTYVARAQAKAPGTSASSVLETAPPYLPTVEVNQAMPNRSGAAEGPALSVPPPAEKETTPPRQAPPAQGARLGSQLQRVRAQYP